MNKTILVAMTLGALLALGGCNGERSPPSPAAQPAAPTRMVQESLSDPSQMLTVRPGAIDRCEAKDGLIPVEISWNATAAKTEGVQLFLQNAGEERKLWAAAGAVGKDTTGKWMRDGATVILVNAKNNQELAQLVLKDVPCD